MVALVMLISMLTLVAMKKPSLEENRENCKKKRPSF